MSIARLRYHHSISLMVHAVSYPQYILSYWLHWKEGYIRNISFLPMQAIFMLIATNTTATRQQKPLFVQIWFDEYVSPWAFLITYIVSGLAFGTVFSVLYWKLENLKQSKLLLVQNYEENGEVLNSWEIHNARST